MHELYKEIENLKERNVKLETKNKYLGEEVETLIYINEEFSQEANEYKKSIKNWRKD